MSFRYTPIGAPCACRSTGADIEVLTHYGTVERFTVNLGVTTDWQLFSFDGKYTSFVLVTLNTIFVGRRDGCWSGYDKEGNLTRMGTWDKPAEHEPPLTGVYRGKGSALHPAFMEPNCRVVNIEGVANKTYVLNEPLDENSLIPEAISSAVTKEPEKLYIILKGGMLDVERSGHFVVPSTPGGNYPEVSLYARRDIHWFDILEFANNG